MAEELLISALQSEHGIAVQSADIEHLRRHLNQAKAQLIREGHGEFACLSFRTSPHSLTELWIVKQEKPDASSEHGPGADAHSDQKG